MDGAQVAGYSFRTFPAPQALSKKLYVAVQSGSAHHSPAGHATAPHCSRQLYLSTISAEIQARNGPLAAALAPGKVLAHASVYHPPGGSAPLP